MIEGIGAFGAWLAVSALQLGLLFAVVWIGVHAAKRTGRNWLGWTAGLLAFVALVLVFGPTMDALDRVKCSGADDFERCVEGD